MKKEDEALVAGTAAGIGTAGGTVAGVAVCAAAPLAAAGVVYGLYRWFAN